MAAVNVDVVIEVNPPRQEIQLTRLAHTECTRGSVRCTSVCFVTDMLWFPTNTRTSLAYVFEMAVLGRRTEVCQTS